MEKVKANFGVGGFPPAFYETDYRRATYGKKREGIFPWLKSLGLDWLELECTYGVKMPHDQALDYARHAKENDIGLSIHAPYYCVLASSKPETIKRSKQDLIACFDLATTVGANRIIFHPGYPCREDRQEALDMIVTSLKDIEKFRPEGVHIYPEIGGKTSQLGSLEDIIYLCDQVGYARPCLDLAHLHARELGSLISADSIVNCLDTVETCLGRDILEESHFHVYPVEINKHGEKAHRAFFDTTEMMDASSINPVPDSKSYYPLAEDFIRAVKSKGLAPTVVCEARNSQEHGAMLMKRLYG